MKQACFIILLNIVGLSGFTQINLEIESAEVFCTKINGDTFDVHERHCYGPGIELICNISNIGDKNIKINPKESEFYIFYQYKDEDYKEDILLRRVFDSHEYSTVELSPQENMRVLLISTWCFKKSIYQEDKTDYLKDMEKILPSVKLLFKQPLNQEDFCIEYFVTKAIENFIIKE